jgi:hypothetical protein
VASLEQASNSNIFYLDINNASLTIYYRSNCTSASRIQPKIRASQEVVKSMLPGHRHLHVRLRRRGVIPTVYLTRDVIRAANATCTCTSKRGLIKHRQRKAERDWIHEPSADCSREERDSINVCQFVRMYVRTVSTNHRHFVCFFFFF